jgi:hypothetical protein
MSNEEKIAWLEATLRERDAEIRRLERAYRKVLAVADSGYGYPREDTDGLPVLFYSPQQLSNRLTDIGIPLTADRIRELAQGAYIPCWFIGGVPCFDAIGAVRYVLDEMLQRSADVRPFPSIVVRLPHPDSACGDVPKELAGIKDYLFDYPASVSSAVYFLIAANEIVYVGQSGSVEARIGKHKNDGEKVFDRALVFPVPPSERLDIEDALIAWLKPKYNAQHGIGGVGGHDLLVRYGFSPPALSSEDRKILHLAKEAS